MEREGRNRIKDGGERGKGHRRRRDVERKGTSSGRKQRE